MVRVQGVGAETGVRCAGSVALLAAMLALVGLWFLLPGTAIAGRSLPPVQHVFVIVLENENADSTFGAQSTAPYLARTLVSQGQFLPNYYGVTHVSLGNYIALISGQGASSDTQVDCPVYRDFLPGTLRADGQALGQGCVYPKTVQTIADQLAARGETWRGYMEDMANSPSAPATCRHPAPDQFDPTLRARVGDQYATRHNPFVYFHSIIDSPACAQNDVPLTRLAADLAAPHRTPNYVFISPNLCHDGHDEPCVSGEPGGLASADRFLQEWVPRIMRSRAYHHGLLVITFDEAEAGGASPDASACCDEQQFPNVANNGGPTIQGRGGGRVGAVVLSPFVKAGSVNLTAYNHYSLLRSVEDLFDLRHLGYAGQQHLQAFGSDVFGRHGRGRDCARPCDRLHGLPAELDSNSSEGPQAP
jgi:hypothetical protein